MAPLLHSPLSLLVASLLVIATGAQAQGATTKLCPGIIGCSNEGLDILVTLDDTKSGHVTRVKDLPACQSFCHTTKHTFYRFLPRLAPKMPLCFCFDGCASLLVGTTTVGVVASCPQNQIPQQALGITEVAASTGRNMKRGDKVKSHAQAGHGATSNVAVVQPQPSKAVNEKSNARNNVQNTMFGSMDQLEEVVRQRLERREAASQKQALVDSIMEE